MSKPRPTELDPILQLVSDRAGGLDDLQLQIVADEQAAHPPLPDPARVVPVHTIEWIQAVRRAS